MPNKRMALPPKIFSLSASETPSISLIMCTVPCFEFQVADENAWDVGLACGGRVQIYLERIE